MILSSFYHQISEAQHENGISLEAALEKARELGIKNFDVNILELDYRAPKEFCELVKKYGMTCCFHGAPKVDVSSEKGYGKALETFKAMIDKAVAAEGLFFMAVPQIDKEAPKLSWEELTEGFTRLFCDLVEYGKQKNITVTVENFSLTELPYSRISDIKKLLDRIPDLMFNYDSGNFVAAGEDEIEGVKAFADRTVNVHLKDVVIKDINATEVSQKFDFVEIGSGTTKIPQALAILKESGYDGIVTIEVDRPWFDRTVASVEPLKKMIADLA